EALETLAGLGSGVELLDQTGQAVTGLPREDHGDRGSAVLSDQAVLFTCLGAVEIRRGECPAEPAYGRSGFESLAAGRAADGQQRGSESSHGEATIHRGTFSCVENLDSGPPRPISNGL